MTSMIRRDHSVLLDALQECAQSRPVDSSLRGVPICDVVNWVNRDQFFWLFGGDVSDGGLVQSVYPQEQNPSKIPVIAIRALVIYMCTHILMDDDAVG